MTCLSFGQTTIYTQDFENVESGYLSSTTEGSTFTDVFNRIDASAAAGGNIGGNSTFIWAVEDSNETPGSINLSQIDVTGYSDFTFSIDMLAHHFEDWDSTDELLISYSIDGGTNQNLMWVQMVPNPSDLGDNFNGPAALDTNFDGDGDCGASNTLPALTSGTQHSCAVTASDFATFTSAVISLNGNTTLDITLEFNGMTSGDEGIYLDDISVDANLAGGGCTEPFQASSFTSLIPTTTEVDFEFTRGGGDDVLVVMREGSAVDADPISGTSYTANSIFNGPGASEIGTGNYVVFNGNNGTSNPGVGGASLNLSVSGLTPDTTYHLAIYEYNTIDTCYNVTEFTGSFNTVAETTIQFTSASDSVPEASGTYDLVIEIADQDVTNATTFDVLLTSGDAADIANYTTQSNSFPGGSTTDVTITITVTDDAILESDEVFTFEIQNVAGGNNASAGFNNTFNLTITNDDPPATIALPYSEDFSDCGTAQWLPFNVAGSNSWTCDVGQYTMNGFPNTDDIDWLISNFSIDFDLTSNENIAITTSEQFGDDVNSPGEFELRYSTNYAGFGDPSGATWTALTFDPNNTSTGFGTSADTVTYVDASSISGTAYLAFFYETAAGSGAEEWNITEVTIQEGALPSSVQFTSTNVSIAEDAGTYDLEFAIENEDAINDTTFDVVLISGDAADINSYTTQTVTFLASTSANQTVTITITDDMLEELDETLTFEIQNVAGGNSAVVGTNNTFNLTISANDTFVDPDTLYDADFSNNGDGFPAHTTSSPPAVGPASVGPFGSAPNQWTLSYDTAPGTDGSANTFEVVIGELISDDWGGQGIFTSQVIDVSSITSVDIYATGANIGANDDDFTYFYILDGGARVETVIGVSDNGDPVNYAVAALDVSFATSLEVGFEFSENGGGDGYAVSEFVVVNAGDANPDTSVQFTTTSSTVIEDDGTFDLTFQISNEDATNDTTFDVLLISGDTADIDGYITQSVNFPAGTSSDQTVTVTITDDMIEESNETFTFEIQNVAGGNNAAVASNSTFDLTIQDNDGTIPEIGDLVITEIMYNSTSTDDEWIEIYNASGSDITLGSEWQLSYGSGPTTFNFSGTVITAGSYLTVAIGSDGVAPYNVDNPFTPDVSIFSLPADAAVTSNTNQLVNSSTTIALTFEPSGTNLTIDAVVYDDGAPWPTAADGDGPSLELIDVAFDNSLGANWIASGNYDGGTPGSEYIAPIVFTYNGTWSPSDPNGTATAGDDIVIASGDASISANTTCNSVTVNPGAGITVNSGVTLTTSNGILLESTSTSFSSLILDGTVIGNLTYDRYVNINGSGSTGSNDLVSAPLTGQQFNEVAGANPNILNNGTLYLFGPFNKAIGQYLTWAGTETTTLDAGVGYRAATSDGSVVRFMGTAENSNVDIDIQNAGPNSAEWNLVGNPYPSYLNVQDFLLHDVGGVTNVQLFDAPTAAIYGYDGSAQNGWTIYNLATTNSSTLIAPGQGFFVSADATNADLYDLQFTPAMRSTGNSDDFIAGRNAELVHFSLNLSTNTNSNKAEFYFNPSASEGFDLGYDARVWEDTVSEFGIYSHLIQDNIGEPMALQAMKASSLSDVTIPIGVHASAGEQLRFAIFESTLSESVNIYLEDVVANTSTLLNNSDYIITPSTDLSGTGRFYLRTSEDSLSSIENELETLNMYYTKNSKELVISGQLKENAILNLYDIQGRTVVTAQLDYKNLENRINVSTLSGGVYIVSVDNHRQQKTEKIIID